MPTSCLFCSQLKYIRWLTYHVPSLSVFPALFVFSLQYDPPCFPLPSLLSFSLCLLPHHCCYCSSRCRSHPPAQIHVFLPYSLLTMQNAIALQKMLIVISCYKDSFDNFLWKGGVFSHHCSSGAISRGLHLIIFKNVPEELFLQTSCDQRQHQNRLKPSQARMEMTKHCRATLNSTALADLSLMMHPNNIISLG